MAKETEKKTDEALEGVGVARARDDPKVEGDARAVGRVGNLATRVFQSGISRTDF